MKIVFFGTPQFAVPTLEKLVNHPEFEVLAVLTQPDKRRERGNQLTYSQVKACAINHNITLWQPERVKKDVVTQQQLKQLNADVFVVVAYGQILSRRILNMPKLGCINVHGSLLPKYRGAAPIQWCLYHGERETGITTMLMDEGMDTGAMLLKSTVPAGLMDNAEILADQLAAIGADLLVETLEKLANQEIVPIPQNHASATYAALIQKQDYHLDWSRSALQLHNQIRGFYPHCMTTFRGQALRITSTAPIHPDGIDEVLVYLPEITHKIPDLSTGLAKPGEVIYIIKGIGAIVQTGDGGLLLREVQLSGKRLQSGGDFVNGTRLAIGEFLGN
jgi:methionyl-tRNA formyltransferase